MTQLFTGEGLGLQGSSLGLGSYGPKGVAGLGQGNNSVYVNAANGNLVLKQGDGFLADAGFGFDLFQVYNSQGVSGSNWRFNLQAKLEFGGSPNTVGSSVVRIGEDGHRTSFHYDAQKQTYLPDNGGISSLTYSFKGWTYKEGGQKTESHYNLEGRLTDISDKDGHSLRFNYTDGGQLESIVDNSAKQRVTWSFKNGLLQDLTTTSEGQVIHHTHFEYDSHNRLHKVSRDLGQGATFWTTYEYEGDSNRITDIKQSDGTTLHCDYDTQGRVKCLIDGEGRISTYHYDQGATTITNSLGESWTYSYDEKNRLTGIDGPEGYRIRYQYEGTHLSSIIQGNQITSFTYNDAGDCIRIEESTGKITQFAYDAEHRLIAQTSYLAFDANHHPIKPVTTRYVYDTRGHLLFTLDVEGHVTENRYDEEGRLTSSRTYLNATFDVNTPEENSILNPDQLLTWCTEQNASEVSLSTYNYDWRGQLTEETHYKTVDTNGEGQIEGALTTRCLYDASGRLIQRSLPTTKGWHTTYYFYDDLGRLIQTSDDSGHNKSFEYDDAHQRIIQTDANGLQTIQLFDKSGLLLSTTRLDATHAYGKTTYLYDSAGRLICETGVDGKSSYSFYDHQGRLQATVDSRGVMTEYHYTLDGLLLQTHQYENPINTQNWLDEYPNFNQIKPEASPKDRVSQVIYNEYNQIAYRIDAQGAVIAYFYDAQGQVIRTKAYANKLNSFNPEQLGFNDIHLVENNTLDRTALFYYDKQGRLSAQINGEGYATAYHYDALGNCIETCRYANKVTNPQGLDWQQDIPSLNPKQDIHTYSLYDARGLKTADIDAEGYVTEYRYNDRGLLQTRIAYEKAIPIKTVINETTTIDQIRPHSCNNDHQTTYLYTGSGLLETERTQTGLITTYAYDEMNQLISKSLMDEHTLDNRQQRYRYDALGRVTQSLNEKGAALLIAQTNASPEAIEQIWANHSTTYVYNNAGLLISQTNALHQSTRYFYDKNQQLRYTINADGGVIETRYNTLGELELTKKYSAYLTAVTATTNTQGIAAQLALIEDARFDEVIRYEYNTLGQRVAQYHGDNINTTDYNAFGDIQSNTQFIDANHTKITAFEYDKRGLLVDSTEDLGGINKHASYQYNAFGQLTQQTDGRFNTINFTWNKRGEQITLQNASGAFKKFTYDSFGRVLNETDFSGTKKLKTYSYDDKNNQFTVTNPQTGAKITTTSNAFGDSVSIIDPRGFCSEFHYDESGKLIRHDLPEGSSKIYKYDEIGQLIWQEISGGQITQYHYDTTGHILSQTIDPLGLNLTTYSEFDALGRQIKLTNAEGGITQFVYDNQGRLIQSCVDPEGLNLKTEFSYDARGLLIRQTRRNPRSIDQVTAYEWDSLGRRTATINDPDGLNLKTSYQYDANDNLIMQTDAKGHSTHFAYDAKNQCRYQIDARGVVTEHKYNINGYEIQTITYAKTIQALLSYDESSVKAALTPDNTQDHHQFRQFNSEGQIIQAYDARGYLTQYDYDLNGNVKTVYQYENPVSLDMLKSGERPAPIERSARTQQNIYNGLNQLLIQCNSDNYVTQFHYDANGQLIKSTRFSQSISMTSNPYTLENVLERLMPNASLDQTTQYAYDQAGRLSKELSAEGVLTSYTYDGLNHLLSRKVHATRMPQDIDLTNEVQTNNNDRIQHYVYDAAGRERYRISSEGSVLERRYDSVGNVIKELNHGLQIKALNEYTESTITGYLSKDYNVRRTNYVYDAVNRLTSQTNAQNNSTIYTYDAANNVATKTEANRAVWTYVYDEANQLIETHSPKTAVRTALGLEEREIVTKQSFDAFGNVISLIQDAEGLKYTQLYEYDCANQKIKTLYPNSCVSNATNAASNQRQESIETLSEEIVYNAFGQISATRDKAGYWAHNTYDKQGLLVYHIDSQGTLTQYLHDGLDRLTKKTTYANRITIAADSDFSILTINNACEFSSQDRHEYYEYTKDNQIKTLQRDPVRCYNPKTQHYDITLQPTTLNTYNTFGELVQTSVRINESDWANTFYYYDKDGHKTATVDAEGYVTTWVNNAFGEIKSTTEYALASSKWDTEQYAIPQTNSKDRTVTFTYDDLGRVTKKTLKQVSFQRLKNDGHSYETLTSDLSTTYEYDALGHITATTDAQGHTSYCYYNELGQLIATVAPPTQEGRGATTYAFDALGNLVETKRWAKGVSVADVFHFELKGNSNQDITTQNAYDLQGHVISETDGLNHQTFYSYDANGNLARSWKDISQVDGKHFIQDKRYTYDSEHHLLQTATFKNDGSLKTEDALYNAFGELIAKGIDGQYATKVEYDCLGRVWRSNTEGYYQIFVYDLMNNLTQIVTSTNTFRPGYSDIGIDLSNADYDDSISFDLQIRRYDLQRQDNCYDALGHLVSQSKCFTEGDVNNLHLEFANQSQKVDRWGNSIASITSKGYETRYEYNAFNQIIRQELPEVKVVDDKGVARQLNPVTYYAYDEVGQAIAMTDAEGHTVGKRYDAQGRVISEIDAKGNTRQKHYNLLDQLSNATNELDVLTTYTYDANNRLLSVKTPKTSQEYTYSEDGQLIKQKIGLHEETLFWYDSRGNQIQSRDASGHDTFYEYNDAGQKTKQTDAAGNSLSWKYSPDGRLIEHTDLGNHTTTYQYNRNGLLLEEQSTSGKHIKYQYRGDGKLSEYIDEATQEVVHYKYNVEGQLTSKEAAKSGDCKYGWIRETDYYQYDALGRLEQVRRRRPDDTDNRFPDKDNALLSIDYEYDAVGNIRHTHVEANYTGYTKVTNDDYYTYDENNRMTTNKGQLINDQIQMTTSQGSTLSYDKAGNIKDAYKIENGAIQHYSYYYTKDNQLELIQKNGKSIQAKDYDDAGHVFHDNLFDEQGVLTQKNTFAYEKGQLVSQNTLNSRDFEVSKTTYLYDDAGNMKEQNVRINGEGRPGYNTRHQYSYALTDIYLQTLDEVSVTVDDNPTTTYGNNKRIYDVNDQLQETIDSGDAKNSTNYWSSSLEGIKARKNAQGQTSYLTINGKTIGDIHLSNDNKQELTVYGGFNPSGSQQAVEGIRTDEFLERAPGDIADGTLPECTQDNLGAYTVQAGDTLEHIALTVYGDSSLWYLLADANGIGDKNAQAGNSGALQIGQRINLPAVSIGQHQTNATHKVLNTSHMLGNISASITMPPPPPPLPQKNNIFAVIGVAIICVVATVFTAGVIGALATGVSGTTGLGGLFSLGTSILGGTSSLGVAGVLGTSFTAGFVGNLISQGAATNLGIQDQISMKSALVTGIATAATAGIAKGADAISKCQKAINALDKLSIPKAFNTTTAAKTMAQNVASQSLNLAISSHQHFAWDELAVTSLSGGLIEGSVGEAINNKIDPLLAYGDLGTGILSKELNALTNAATNAITGKSFDAKQVLVDNLGSAIGESIVHGISSFNTNFAPVVESKPLMPFEQEAQSGMENNIEEGAYSPIPTPSLFDDGTTYMRSKEQYADYEYRENRLKNKSDTYEALAFDSDLFKSQSAPKAIQSFENKEFEADKHLTIGKSNDINYAELLKKEDFKIYLSTIYGESGNQSPSSWAAIANVINNRVGYREWSKYKTQLEVIKHTGFDAYWKKTRQYEVAYNSLSRDKLNSKLTEMMRVVAPVYLRLTKDSTNGAVLYYSPKAQASLAAKSKEYKTVPNWRWNQLNRVYPTGVARDDFAFYKYK